MTNATLRIVTATHADIHTLSRIGSQGFAETFGHLYAPENLTAHLKKTCSPEFFGESLSKDTIMISWLRDEAVGYVKAGRIGLPVQPDFPAMELQRLYVLSPWQGQRIGDALIQVALELPMMKAAHGIYVGAWENNHRAHRFYGKYGFVPVGEYLYHVGPHTDREIILLKRQEQP